MNSNVLQAIKQTPNLKEDLYFQDLKYNDLHLHRRCYCKGQFKTKRHGLLSLECFTFMASFQNLCIVFKSKEHK